MLLSILLLRLAAILLETGEPLIALLWASQIFLKRYRMRYVISLMPVRLAEGLNENVPFSETSPTEHPVALYGATKKANELIAHAYIIYFKYRLRV